MVSVPNSPHFGSFVGGQLLETGNETALINPFTEEPWATADLAGDGVARHAVTLAAEAQRLWWKESPATRATALWTLGDLVDRHADRLAEIETVDTGRPIRETRMQMEFSARVFRYYAGVADKLFGESIPVDEPTVVDFTVREPHGVCGLIIPFNAPMQIAASKSAPALAAGNSVVIKPSSYACATPVELAKLAMHAGVPPGVLNVVLGGEAVGQELTESPEVSMLSFTGGVSAGRKVAAVAGDRIVPIVLELGGKSANVVFDDARLDRAVAGSVVAAFTGAGQSCHTGSRLLVQRTILDSFTTQFVAAFSSMHVGDPRDPETRIGPLINAAACERVEGYVSEAESLGAAVHKSPAGVPSTGYFHLPTALVGGAFRWRLWREEAFGPVVTITPFEDETEALQLANDSDYGLAAGVWSQDVGRCHRMARSLVAGTVWINTYRAVSAGSPFGGRKGSGYGRDRGMEGLDSYLNTKNIMIEIS